jgi:ABC-2 type transport system ATP-binding protein
MTTTAIEVHALRKSYSGKIVLDDVDLTVSAGTVTALLGPNGAGKTTTVHILSTLVRPDAGSATVAGCDVVRDPDGVRAVIGLTGQFSAVDSLLTGEENLLLMADLHHLGRAEGRRRAAALLGQFGLADAAGKTAMTYSGGMRRRLDLAMTLTGDPSIIFLDEPTTGLDPRSRRMMWQTIRELVAGGVTIFLTTQQLDEADALADHIALLDHGKVVAAGSPEELKRGIPGAHVRLRFSAVAGLDAAERALGGAFRHRVRLYADCNAGTVDAQRNCISNIRPEGLPIPQAAGQLVALIAAARRHRMTGVELGKCLASEPALNEIAHHDIHRS